MSTGDGRGMSIGHGRRRCPVFMEGNVQLSWEEMSSGHGRRGCPVFMGGGDVDVWWSWEGKDVQWGGEDVDVWWSCEGEMSIGHGSRCSVVMAMSNGRA